MSVYINGKNIQKPYINGKRYNAYINGKKVWGGAIPPGMVPTDSAGTICWEYGLMDPTGGTDLSGAGFCTLWMAIYNTAGSYVSTETVYYMDTMGITCWHVANSLHYVNLLDISCDY